MGLFCPQTHLTHSYCPDCHGFITPAHINITFFSLVTAIAFHLTKCAGGSVLESGGLRPNTHAVHALSDWAFFGPVRHHSTLPRMQLGANQAKIRCGSLCRCEPVPKRGWLLTSAGLWRARAARHSQAQLRDQRAGLRLGGDDFTLPLQFSTASWLSSALPRDGVPGARADDRHHRSTTPRFFLTLKWAKPRRTSCTGSQSLFNSGLQRRRCTNGKAKHSAAQSSNVSHEQISQNSHKTENSVSWIGVALCSAPSSSRD